MITEQKREFFLKESEKNFFASFAVRRLCARETVFKISPILSETKASEIPPKQILRERSNRCENARQGGSDTKGVKSVAEAPAGGGIAPVNAQAPPRRESVKKGSEKRNSI